MSGLDGSDRHDLSKAAVTLEEAIVNAMVAAKDMTGADGHRVIALPHDRLQAILKKYNRLMP
jgi:D-aminopeptidase